MRILGSWFASLAILSASIMSLSSCAGARERLSLMEGNFLANRGRNREAVASYLRTLENPEVAPYGEYGLGCVYLALGEIEPALGRFAAVEKAAESSASVNEELLYRARYNSGLALYRSGDFSGAAEDFRGALEVDGSRTEAKRNLELCLRLLSRKSTTASSSAPLGTGVAENEPKVLFNYIREKESERWKSRVWKAEASSSADY